MLKQCVKNFARFHAILPYFLLLFILFLVAWRQSFRHRGRGGSPPTAPSVRFERAARKSLLPLVLPTISSTTPFHPVLHSCPFRSPRRFKLLMSIFRLVTLSELVHRRSCVLPIKVFNESRRKMASTTIVLSRSCCHHVQYVYSYMYMRVLKYNFKWSYRDILLRISQEIMFMAN